MAYTRRDTEGPSEATPQPYSHEHERANPPPPCMSVAAPSMHCSSYDSQWNAPTLHSGVQDQRYGMTVPYVNGMVCGYGVWADAQQSAAFTPAAGTATNAVTPYMSQNQNHDTVDAANGPTAYHQDNGITATGSRDHHGHFTTAQLGGVVDYGPTPAGGASAHSAGNAIQTFAPGDEAPAPSESLRTLTRRYVLDPGTRFETVNIGPNRCGRLKIIIALEVADGV